MVLHQFCIVLGETGWFWKLRCCSTRLLWLIVPSSRGCVQKTCLNMYIAFPITTKIPKQKIVFGYFFCTQPLLEGDTNHNTRVEQHPSFQNHPVSPKKMQNWWRTINFPDLKKIYTTHMPIICTWKGQYMNILWRIPNAGVHMEARSDCWTHVHDMCNLLWPFFNHLGGHLEPFLTKKCTIHTPIICT